MASIRSQLNPTFPNGFPSIPEIDNEATRIQVFTHRSFHGRPSGRFEDPEDDPSPDNELLEHLGDAVIQFSVTDLLHKLYPRLRPGSASTVRSKVINNDTLAIIATRYQFGKKLRVHISQASLLRETSSVLADTFEAYVGGLYKDQNYSVVHSWIEALFTPYVHEAYKVALSEFTPLSPPALSSSESSSAIDSTSNLLSSLAVAPNSPAPIALGNTAKLNQRVSDTKKTIRWEESELPPSGAAKVWQSKCFVDNKLIGTGSATSKKSAKNIAAGLALEALGWA